MQFDVDGLVGDAHGVIGDPDPHTVVDLFNGLAAYDRAIANQTPEAG